MSLASLSLKTGRFIFMQAPSSQCHLPHLDPSDQSDLDDIKEPFIMNSGCSETHILGKVKGTKVIEAFDLSNAYCILGLWRADRVTMDDWNHHSQMHLLEENFSRDQTGRVVGPADSHRSPCLNLMICYGLGNVPSTLLNCHWVCGKVG